MARGLGDWEMRRLEWDLRQREYKRNAKKHWWEANCIQVEFCIST